MNTTLKKCPHCGGNASLYSNYSYKTRAYFVFVKCEVCGAQGKITSCDDDPAADEWKNTACETAVSAWNLRVSDKES